MNTDFLKTRQFSHKLIGSPFQHTYHACNPTIWQNINAKRFFNQPVCMESSLTTVVTTTALSI